MQRWHVTNSSFTYDTQHFQRNAGGQTMPTPLLLLNMQMAQADLLLYQLR